MKKKRKPSAQIFAPAVLTSGWRWYCRCAVLQLLWVLLRGQEQQQTQMTAAVTDSVWLAPNHPQTVPAITLPKHLAWLKRDFSRRFRHKSAQKAVCFAQDFLSLGASGWLMPLSVPWCLICLSCVCIPKLVRRGCSGRAARSAVPVGTRCRAITSRVLVTVPAAGGAGAARKVRAASPRAPTITPAPGTEGSFVPVSIQHPDSFI